MKVEKKINKYKKRGSMHWIKMKSRDIRFFNAYQQARYEWILKIAGDIKGKKRLDIGCGDRSLTYLMCKKGAVVTVIYNEELGLDLARENLRSEDSKNSLKYEFINAPAYNLPSEKDRLIWWLDAKS